MKITSGIVRKIDELGRIVVPKETRELLNINEGDPVELFYDDSGRIMIRKYHSSGCILCSNINQVIMFKGKFCDVCFNQIIDQE